MIEVEVILVRWGKSRSNLATIIPILTGFRLEDLISLYRLVIVIALNTAEPSLSLGGRNCQ